MKYTELKEIIMNWDEEQKKATHFLLKEGEYLDEIIETINNYDYRIYKNLEEYILSYIEETQDAIPTWVCIDVVATYFYSIIYNNNIMFMLDFPKWAKNSSKYGTEEERQRYKEGVKYLCEYSEVLEVYR